MKKLLHIIASPRGDDSRTLKVSAAFLDEFTRTHPDWVVEPLDLFDEELPEMTVRRLDGKYMLIEGGDLYGAAREAWEEVLWQIERFKSADGYLLSTPMWNFSIPYRLKQYIDLIVQPKYTFRYTPSGAEGLVAGRKMAVVISRGGAYGSGPMASSNHQEPYLKTIFGFIGVKDLTFIVAEPMDSGDRALRDRRMEEAALAARGAARAF